MNQGLSNNPGAYLGSYPGGGRAVKGGTKFLRGVNCPPSPPPTASTIIRYNFHARM